jgi:hypothetical protein
VSRRRIFRRSSPASGSPPAALARQEGSGRRARDPP